MPLTSLLCNANGDTPKEACISEAHPLVGTIRDCAAGGGFMLSVVVRILFVLLLAVTLTGCAAVAGIFKAGFWVGIVIAVVVVVALFALFGRRG